MPVQPFVRHAASAALLALGVAGTATPAVAQAQPPSAQVPAVSPEPQQTTATFGDWVLRCTRIGPEANRQRACEVVQTLQRERQQGIIAQIALGRPTPRDPLKVTVLLPANISIPGAVRMDIDEKDPGPVDLGWRRCFAQGCIADAEAREDTLRRWRSQAGPGRLTFRDAANRDVSLQMSFKGLAQALDALAKI